MIGIKMTGLKGVKALLDPKKMTKVVRSAVDRTATSVGKEGTKIAVKTYNISDKRIKRDSRGTKTVRVKRTREGTSDATVIFQGRAPGLQHFGIRKARGSNALEFKIEKRGSHRTLERGFYQTIDQARNIWSRKGRERYPIERRTGPSIVQMYEQSGQVIVEAMIPIWQKKFFDIAFIKQFGAK
jgi:hypothetical protein